MNCRSTASSGVMEVQENRFAVLRDLLDGHDDASSLLAKAAPPAAEKQKPKAAAAAVSAASMLPSRPVPPSQHVLSKERGSRGTASNSDRWIDDNKKNPRNAGWSNGGFTASGKEETGTSGRPTRGVPKPNRSAVPRQVAARDFPGNKTIRQEDYEKDNELTFAEYQKSIQEKRKALEAHKPEERKVAVENQFEGMNLIGKKKEDDHPVNMESGKNKPKKVGSGKEGMVCKSIKIGQFQIPIQDEPKHRSGRGGGTGCGGYRGGSHVGGRGRQAVVLNSQDDVGFPPLPPASTC